MLPSPLAIHPSKHYAGSVSDFEMFQRFKEFHLSRTKKRGVDVDVRDVRMHGQKYGSMQATLVEKGSQGAFEILRAIHSIIKPPRSTLSLSDESFNRNISSDRVLVENFFGGLAGLWVLVSSEGNWSFSLFNDFLKLAVASKNYHIQLSPLCASDASKFLQIKNRLASIADESQGKRRDALWRYRDRRWVRIAHKFWRDQYVTGSNSAPRLT